MSGNIVIANTTPLIALADVGHLELLHQLFGKIYIPEAVLLELKSEPASSEVRRADWIKKEKITDQGSKRLFQAKLHSGEVEVMILAQEMKADLLIMDDNAAKKTAKFLGFDVTGTMGVLIRAKELGYLNEVRPVLEALVADGLYISDSLKRRVLKIVNEY